MNRFVFVFLILFVFSCNQTKKNAFLASVGNSVLTEKEARLSADLEGGSIKEVVNRWVEEEILFQNAQSSVYYEENNSFAGIEKRLAGQLFLQRIAGEGIKVSNSEIKSYYQKNKSGFIRKNKSARIYHFLFSSKKEAKTAFKILSSNKNEEKKNRLFEERGAQPVIVIDEELLPELSAPLFSSRKKKRLLGPIKSSYGYHIIVVLERFKKNSPIPLEEMYDEIYQRIYQQKFALKSLRILDSLRNHTPYQINL